MCIDKCLKDVRCSNKCGKACYKLPAKHKLFSLLIGPNDIEHYDVTSFPDMFRPNIISDGLTNELSIHQLVHCTKCTLYLSTTNCLYCEIIFSCWTCSLVYFMGRTIQEFKIQMKYFFTLVIFNIIWNPWMQVSTNMSNVVKPRY